MIIIYGMISDKLSEKSKMQNKLDRKWSSVIKKKNRYMYVCMGTKIPEGYFRDG